jgi:hypothetical protein
VTLDQEIDTMSHRDRLRDVEAVLLVAATVLLVVGTSLERSQAASETRQAATVQRSAGESGEHGEHGEASEPGETAEQGQASEHGEANHDETAEAAAGGHDEAADRTGAGEELFGIDLEWVGLTVAAVVVSLLLAGLLLLTAGRPVLVAVIVALAFLALDLRESVHQASEARAGLLTIAALTALAHLGDAGLAGGRLVAPRRQTLADTNALVCGSPTVRAAHQQLRRGVGSPARPCPIL